MIVRQHCFATLFSGASLKSVRSYELKVYEMLLNSGQNSEHDRLRSTYSEQHWNGTCRMRMHVLNNCEINSKLSSSQNNTHKDGRL